MRVDFNYFFLPTAALLEAAALANVRYEVQPSAWSDAISDRIGKQNPQSMVEAAFWNVFLAGLFYEEPEPESMRLFRARCLELGFSGCWSVIEVQSGGSVSELLEENKQAVPFLAKHAVVLKSPK